MVEISFLAFQTPIASKDVSKGTFVAFSADFYGWNALPDSLILSAEGVEKDCVAKFTSLVRARD